MLFVKEISRVPVDNLLTLEELQEHIRQDDTFEENKLMLCYFSAVDFAEKYTNRYFTETTIATSIETYQNKIPCPYDITSIVSAEAKDNLGNIVEINIDYNYVSNVFVIDNKYSSYTDFEIIFTTGYADGQCPKAILGGILMVFATLYEVREDVSYGVTANQVPFRSTMMLDAYKNYITV